MMIARICWGAVPHSCKWGCRRITTALHSKADCSNMRLLNQPNAATVAKKRPRFDDLRDEVVAVGFYISGHPLEELSSFIRPLNLVPIADALTAIRVGRGFHGSVSGVVQ